jgi:guanine nucleotide-binding protein subunit gamma
LWAYLQVPSVWGPVGKNEDPYAPQGGGKCCVVQ